MTGTRGRRPDRGGVPQHLLFVSLSLWWLQPGTHGHPSASSGAGQRWLGLRLHAGRQAGSRQRERAGLVW